MTKTDETATQTARDYYNSHDADNFYYEVWGGEDIHVGLYDPPSEDIASASRKTVKRMADRVVEAMGELTPDHRILDIGAGFGGAARQLVDRFGCHVTCVNLSEAENERNRKANAERNLENKITVIDGSFDDVPADDATFDVIWSQDAILHAADRVKVLKEADRVLKPGGVAVFTDPMQADDCPEGVLQPILDRIHLSSLGSPGFYLEQAKDLGWQDLGFEKLTHQLANHYTRVREEAEKAKPRLKGKVSDEYLERMHKGLGHWIEAGNADHLAWGIFLFRKP
jgi:sarcosine/dimethylglycine N-methyltransferase